MDATTYRPMIDFNKVFIIGLPKTGTLSIVKALSMFNIKICHNPTDEQTYSQIISHDFNLSVLQNFDGLSDLQASCFFEELSVCFPNSVFIYNTRSTDKWIESCRKWWEKIGANSPEGIKTLPLLTVYMKTVKFGTVKFDEQKFLLAREQHERKVDEFRKKRATESFTLALPRSLLPFLGRR